MTSPKQVAANRRNALRSTGPRTPAGKALSSLNALKHGVLSGEVLLPSEEKTTLEELRQRIRIELRPVGELERFLVDRIVANAWRLRRLLAAERGLGVVA